MLIFFYLSISVDKLAKGITLRKLVCVLLT